jgi:hypothetical protein
LLKGVRFNSREKTCTLAGSTSAQRNAMGTAGRSVNKRQTSSGFNADILPTRALHWGTTRAFKPAKVHGTMKGWSIQQRVQ